MPVGTERVMRAAAAILGAASGAGLARGVECLLLLHAAGWPPAVPGPSPVVAAVGALAVLAFPPFGLAPALVVALAVLGEAVPKERMGSANAAFSFFYGIGSVSGPLVTGWVVELTSLPAMFYPMAAAALLFVMVAFRSSGGRARSSGPPE